MHTTHSDGTGTVQDIVEAAHEAGLKWVIITDHDSLGGKPLEGWHGDVLVLVGHEVTPSHSHFLALNVDEVISRRKPTQQYVDEAYARGGFGILAHPDDHLADKSKAIHPWADWTIDGPSEREGRSVGLEIWNFMSDWRAKRQTHSREQRYHHPEQVLSGPTPTLLAWWDRLNSEGRRTFGIGGLDAHATREHSLDGTTQIKVFPYEWMFGSITNYLLLDAPLSPDVSEARQQVYTALTGGRSYFVNRLDGTAPALPFWASRAGQTWQMGDSPSLADGPLTLHLESGPEAEMRLIHNGKILLTTAEATYEQHIDQPGVYRLEGHRNGRPWLFTNPLYVQE